MEKWLKGLHLLAWICLVSGALGTVQYLFGRIVRGYPVDMPVIAVDGAFASLGVIALQVRGCLLSFDRRLSALEKHGGAPTSDSPG
jgi:hypothetical protein